MSHAPVRRRILVAGLALAGLAAVPSAAPGQTADPTTWLCRPGVEPNPCRTSLTASVLRPDGRVARIERTPLARRPRVDCFYVYPTVSQDATPNASPGPGPEERAIAAFQASRFSSTCRVWAPYYRQVTLGGITNPASVTPAVRQLAYDDVRAAWRAYLQRHNRGRGVILLSHSQGTFQLRRLLREEIEPRPAARRRLVAAHLIGGDVLVARGRRTGGDFVRTPTCRSARELGCVVAYSTYGAAPEPDTRFGTPDAADAARGLEVACTNPAALGGGPGVLRTYVRTDPFPGIIGDLVEAQVGELPPVRTPWLRTAGGYRARCSSADGANVLRVTPSGGARTLVPQPTPEWGLHLADVNLALGNLTELAGRQARAYLRARR